MPVKKHKDIDLGRSLKSFFELPDWQERTLFIGGLFVGLMLLYVLFLVTMFIPLIGIIASCCFLVMFPLVSMAVNFYVDGYRTELTDALVAGKTADSVRVSGNYQERIITGFKLGVSNLIYNIPLILLYVVGYVMLIAPVFAVSIGSAANDELSGLAMLTLLSTTLMFYVFILIGWFWQIVQMYLIYPVMFIFFRKERSIRDALRVRKMVSFVRNNYMNVLIYSLVMLGIALLFGMAMMVSVLLVFLCIGIIIAPVVFAVGTTYTIHLQADMLAQMERNSR
ncbi:MAG: hypothetical protein TR69_WS6001001110 [candidate division WS6 bacterium OLB20]|uniref:Glycerophosphoryl diester phosphodiesterase membrane domain-containing protein n=1 Tax=candidate division WS6 bacterium OLB20 TaxID=1617426 RepID=A0A136LZK5_9BACT|nr:MAG: hypothetical protein TR69_WS6001001110 [candidate division WS6 bacterium OLB20]